MTISELGVSVVGPGGLDGLQRFGSVEIDGEQASAMLCFDSDRPDDAMVHWWGASVTPAAVLMSINRSSEEFELKPQRLYRQAESGVLFLPPKLTEEEQNWMTNLRAALRLVGTRLEGSWHGPDGRSGAIEFASPAAEETLDTSLCASWDDFKSWAAKMRRTYDAQLFRGHGSNKFKLQTTLHRAGRSRIERYCSELLVQFKLHAEAVLGMRFNLNDGEDYSTVLGLAQHHGLPTPLLDWTESPYVAAFFAFADAVDSSHARLDSTHVRVYALARHFVDQTSPNAVVLPTVQPYVASLSISARHNPRLYVQQGHFMVTNVAGIEDFILHAQRARGQTWLRAADVPIALAEEALEDLAYMGLTAAAMFPGLDGVCRKMKHAMSFKRQVPLPPPLASQHEQPEAHDASSGKSRD